ncbi:hypothetical protein ACLKA6_006173 [Drosophila palustris]
MSLVSLENQHQQQHRVNSFEKRRYLELVSMSMCGMQENGGPPSDEEFDRQLVTYPDLFPPVKHDEVAVEFSNFNYWRDPIVDLPELQTAAVAPTSTVTVSTKPEIATLKPIPEK